ncbi:MAG: response regulator [Gammaproteobacteria bacterium]|nr:response regulator [Gammaproteobacteria bacterium]
MKKVQTKQTILIVDDVKENIALLNELLSEDYNIVAALNGEKALRLASNAPQPDLILLDILMPGIDGYEVCQRLKANDLTKNIPVIFVSALHDELDEEKGFNSGGLDFVNKPIKPLIVKARVKTHLALSQQNKVLEDKVRERTASLEMSHLETLHGLTKVIGCSNEGKGFHLIRMSHYAYRIAEEMGMSLEWCDLLYKATPLYDIGKIGIPESILLKPGKLTADERKIMESHCEKGSEILENSDDNSVLKMARSIALYHHEKYNGEGYPFALVGDDIPVEGRIMAVVNVFDALTSVRPYKEISSDDEALEIIKQESGQHFDPEIVSIFVHQWQEIIKIKNRFSDASLDE